MKSSLNNFCLIISLLTIIYNFFNFLLPLLLLPHFLLLFFLALFFLFRLFLFLIFLFRLFPFLFPPHSLSRFFPFLFLGLFQFLPLSHLPFLFQVSLSLNFHRLLLKDFLVL